jgi:hypothetical protein
MEASQSLPRHCQKSGAMAQIRTDARAAFLVATADFNGDGHPDWVIRHAATGQTALVYLDNNIVIGAALGPPLPNGWSLQGTADFNRDGKPDYVLYNPSTRQTALWFLNGTAFVSGLFGPSLPSGWTLVSP